MEIRITLVDKNMLKPTLKKLEQGFNPQNITRLNNRRGDAFKEYTIDQVKSASLGLERISDATVKISEEGHHSPLYETGQLLESMEKQTDSGTGDVKVGYITDNNLNKEGISLRKVAILQSTGFRVPKNSMAKFNKMRSFLYHQHGIIITDKAKLNAGYLEIPPRPFMNTAADKWIVTTKDEELAEKWIREILGF